MADTPRSFGHLASDLERAASERTAEPARNILWLHEQIAAIERGDFESLLRAAHDDVTLEIFVPPQFPFITRASGKSELLDAMTHNFGAVVDQAPQIRDIFAEGDTVVLFGRERGTVRQTGTAYDVEFVQRLTFKDARLTSVRIVVADTARKRAG
jgi:ketosteroid isomerase-like protein